MLGWGMGSLLWIQQTHAFDKEAFQLTISVNHTNSHICLSPKELHMERINIPLLPYIN